VKMGRLFHNVAACLLLAAGAVAAPIANGQATGDPSGLCSVPIPRDATTASSSGALTVRGVVAFEAGSFDCQSMSPDARSALATALRGFFAARTVGDFEGRDRVIAQADALSQVVATALGLPSRPALRFEELRID